MTADYCWCCKQHPRQVGIRSPVSPKTSACFENFSLRTLHIAGSRVLLLPVGLPMEIAIGVASLVVQLPSNAEICAMQGWGPDRAIMMEPYALAGRAIAYLLHTTWGLGEILDWENMPTAPEQYLPCHAAFALWQVVAVGLNYGLAAARDRCMRRAFARENAVAFADDGLPETVCFPAGWKFVIAEWLGGFVYTSTVSCVLWAVLIFLRYV
jgi:hypothetical protein